MTRLSRRGCSLRLALAALLTVTLLCSCGFRPRGSISLPDDIQAVYVNGPVEISDEIALFLNEDDVSVVEVRGEEDAVIDIQSDRYDERVVAVDASTGKAREFELLYTLDYSVRMKDGTVRIPSERLVVRRVYVFDPTAVIGATQNVAALQRDMRVDAAQRIVRAMEASLQR